MSFSINRITLLGNVTKDPELKMSKAGKPILKFSLATNHSVKKDDNTYEDIPTFHNVVVFGTQAEWLSKNVFKGTKIYVDGRLTITDYTDKDGVQKRWVEVFSNNVIPMMAKDNTKPASEMAPSTDKPNGKEDVSPNDIPF